MARPLITPEDFLSFIDEKRHILIDAIEPEENAEWALENGIAVEMLTELGRLYVAATLDRIREGERPALALYNNILTAFQVGWEAHKYFNPPQMDLLTAKGEDE